jgi:hypothetical protein
LWVQRREYFENLIFGCVFAVLNKVVVELHPVALFKAVTVTAKTTGRGPEKGG